MLLFRFPFMIVVASVFLSLSFPAFAEDEPTLEIPTAPVEENDTATVELAPPPAPETETKAEAEPETVTEVPAAPEAEPEVAVESPPPAEDQPEAVSVSRRKYDPRVPIYQRVRPQWGVEAAYGSKAFGKTADAPGLPDSAAIRGYSIQMEFQPAFLQSLGVLGFGPSFALYRPTVSGVVNGALGLFSIGGQVRYQARYFREQPLVPYGGFAVEHVRYRLSNGTRGGVTATGPTLGVMLLLNILEPSSAAEMYVNYEIARTYLVAELRTLKGSGGGFNFSAGTPYFGLRFEF